MNPRTPPPDLDPMLRDALLADLRQGHLIFAIKRYRDATGAGLADAKRAVEELRDRNGLGNVRADTSARTNGMLLAGIVVLVAIVVTFVLPALRAHH